MGVKNKIYPTSTVGDADNVTNIRHLSPYFRSDNKKSNLPREVSKIDTVVLHWTGGSSAEGAIRHLFGNGNSYHFIIEKDGTIIQCKPILEKANHAGCSYGPNGAYVNATSIGISFVTVGGMKAGNLIEGKQLENALKLIKDIHLSLVDNGGGLKWFTTHHQISPERKEDPYSLEEQMTKGDNIQKKLRDSLGNKITYWRAGMGPTWPKGLNSDCVCVPTHPPQVSSEIEIDGPNGKVKWCKKTKGSCYIKGGSAYGCSSGNVYNYEAMSVYINDKLKHTGSDDELANDDTFSVESQ